MFNPVVFTRYVRSDKTVTVVISKTFIRPSEVQSSGLRWLVRVLVLPQVDSRLRKQADLLNIKDEKEMKSSYPALV